MTLVIPASYRTDEARLVTKALGAMLAHTARMTPYRAEHALVGSDLRAFAIGSLVRRSPGDLLAQAEASSMSDLVRRVLRLTFAEANQAGTAPPSIRRLASALAVARRREEREAMSGAVSVVFY